MHSQQFYLHLKSVLSKQLCNDLILRAKREGLHPAGVLVHGKVEDLPTIRNNERAVFTDNILPSKIEALLRTSAGAAFPSRLNGMPFSKIGSTFKVYRYLPGNFFKAHKDGRNLIGRTQESKVTVLCYLNDAEGGETILMPDGYAGKDSWIVIAPKRGDVLMFEHDIWHEGRPVSAGEKNVLRSDLFYQIPHLTEDRA